MTKTIKLSLAAALLATSVSAVEFSTSGKMEVELDYAKDAASATSTSWDMDVDATVKAKFNDNFTGVVTAQADYAQNDDVIQNDQNINIVKQYVQYTNGGTTVLAGKQSVGTPFFDDERGTGVVALQNVAGVTVAAATFSSTNIDKSGVNNNDLSSVNLKAFAAIGSVAGVNVSAWFADYTNTADATTIAADTKIGAVSVAARTTEVDYDAAASEEHSLDQISVSMPVGSVTATVAYAETGKNGGANIAEDADATTNFSVDQLSLGDQANADAVLVALSTKVGATSVTLQHLDADLNGTDADETRVAFAYPLAAGAKLTADYTTASVGSDDTDAASVAVEFKF